MDVSGGPTVTVHVLFADPPVRATALPELVADGTLDEASAVTLAEALLKDTAICVTRSGGDLLVNYPTSEQLSSSDANGIEPAEVFREVLRDALPDLDAVRFEPQVGDTPTDRIEHACGQLLTEAEVASVALLDGRAPTLDRTVLDSAGMKLRRSEMVVGPAPGGRVAYLGLTEPLDTAGLSWPFALEALIQRGIDAGFAVDFLPMHPRVSNGAGLHTLASLVRAKVMADRRYPAHTARAIDSIGL